MPVNRPSIDALCPSMARPTNAAITRHEYGEYNNTRIHIEPFLGLPQNRIEKQDRGYGMESRSQPITSLTTRHAHGLPWDTNGSLSFLDHRSAAVKK